MEPCVRHGHNKVGTNYTYNTSRFLLTQFGASINHVGGVYLHVTDVQFHADVLDAHMTLSVQFDGVALQHPRTGHVVCEYKKPKFTYTFRSDRVENCRRTVFLLTGGHVEYTFAHDWNLTDSTLALELAVRHDFRHVKVDF